MTTPTWFEQSRSSFTGELLFDEPLSRHTYYRIGGPARVLAIPRSKEDLLWISEGLKASGLPAIILGAGSNVLASDDGFNGVVIKTSRVDLGITPMPPEASGETCLRLGASVAISTLLRKASFEGWSGLDFLTGIPGSVGGAIAMNAGTHLGESQKAVRKVEAIGVWGERAGEELLFMGEELKFEYRKNLFLPAGSVVVSTEWAYLKDEPARVKAQIDETLARRKATQPIDYPSCGSVFKNPRGAAADLKNAWQVIDRLNLRGHRIGNAQFSEKHCNFIVNHGGAMAADVKALIDLAKSRALAELGITLEEEVKFI